MTHEQIAALGGQVAARVLAWPIYDGGRWFDRAVPDGFASEPAIHLQALPVPLTYLLEHG